MRRIVKQPSTYQRGVAPLAVLAMLTKQDMYGYELVQNLCDVSNGVIRMQEGSLYPVLYKLEEAGWITGKKVLAGKRMTRVYYHLEEKGRQHLKELVDEYEKVTQSVFKIVYGEDAKK